jgi:YVTN family beta-propeller protein
MLNAFILFFINSLFTSVYSATIIDTIIVGNTPQGIDINSQINKVYTANINDDTVSVIDGSSDDLSTTITVGKSPSYVASNPETNKVYVSNNADDTVTVIDGTNNNLLKTISGISNPYDIAVNPVTNKIYVSESGNASVNTVYVIDGSTDVIKGTITVGFGPTGIAVNPLTNKVYVSNTIEGTVSVIDGSNDSLIDTIIVHSGPTNPLPGNDGIAVNPVTNKVYVANSIANSITVIDGENNEIIETITGFQGPRQIAINSDTNRIYVANTAGNTVSIIDGINNNILETITVDNNPFDITVNPLTNKVYVTTTSGNGKVFVISDEIIENNPFSLNFISAIDGNGQPVANVTGETTSTSITFTFAATGDENNIPNFECTLDGVIVVDCLNLDLNQNLATITLNNLNPGNHIFELRTIYTTTGEIRTLDYIWKTLPVNQQHICNAAFPNIDELWPPNHDIRTINILGINNDDDDNYSISITKVLQDEPTQINPGDNSPDAAIINKDLVQLRAERDGNGDGRIYHIQFTVSDQNRDICNGEVLVTVPHDQNKDSIDSGAIFDSTLS